MENGVEVRRSRRRRRSVTAYRDGGRVIVLIPARFTRAEEALRGAYDIGSRRGVPSPRLVLDRIA